MLKILALPRSKFTRNNLLVLYKPLTYQYTNYMITIRAKPKSLQVFLINNVGMRI